MNSFHPSIHPLKQMNSSIHIRRTHARTHACTHARMHARTVYVEDCARLALKYPRFERALVDPIDSVQNSERRQHPPAQSCKPICIATKYFHRNFPFLSHFSTDFVALLLHRIFFLSIAFRGRRCALWSQLRRWHAPAIAHIRKLLGPAI